MIAVTVPFKNKRSDCLFWKEFSKNLLVPIVASLSCKLILVTLQSKPSRTIWFCRSDVSKYLLNPKRLNKLSPKSRTLSRSIVFQHTATKALQPYWIPTVSNLNTTD